jgi:hypothetical protein
MCSEKGHQNNNKKNQLDRRRAQSVDIGYFSETTLRQTPKCQSVTSWESYISVALGDWIKSPLPVA